MKKIGILTYQFADNYGAVLQCYALRKFIDNLQGCEVEVINYIPVGFNYAKKWNTEYEKWLFDEKRKKFEAFLEKHCNISGVPIYSLSQLNKYDVICVGSDQIWNTNKIFLGYFLPKLPEGVKRISYAASLGYHPDSDRLNKDVLNRYLPAFKNISVREQIHVPLVESITHDTCECVLDPTLLLDGTDYEGLVVKETLRKEKFIFFYWLEHEPNLLKGVEFVNSISRKLGISIVHSIINAPDFMFVNDGGNMYYEGIENFLWYIKNAEYVVTNSYHGTIFSILYKKPFYTFIVESMRSRIDTLCNKLGIVDRVIETYLPISAVDDEINFDKIMENRDNERELSIDYLKRALNL